MLFKTQMKGRYMKNKLLTTIMLASMFLFGCNFDAAVSDAKEKIDQYDSTQQAKQQTNTSQQASDTAAVSRHAVGDSTQKDTQQVVEMEHHDTNIGYFFLAGVFKDERTVEDDTISVSFKTNNDIITEVRMTKKDWLVAHTQHFDFSSYHERWDTVWLRIYVNGDAKVYLDSSGVPIEPGIPVLLNQ